MGKFIVFEGIDGSGKSEQWNRLRDFFDTHYPDSAFFTREQTDSPIGKLIDDVLERRWSTDFETLQMLFTADRSHHLAQEIVPYLESGKHVICDRYVISTLAYGGSNLSSELQALNRNFPNPDLTLLVEVSSGTALARLNTRGDKKTIFEKEEKLRIIAHRYDVLVKTFSNIVRIDGERSADEVFADVKKHVERLLGQGDQ